MRPALACAMAITVAALTLPAGARSADYGNLRGAVFYAARAVDAHGSSWRDGNRHRFRVVGCDAEARVLPSGRGHVAVACATGRGWLLSIALREPGGRWRP